MINKFVFLSFIALLSTSAQALIFQNETDKPLPLKAAYLSQTSRETLVEKDIILEPKGTQDIPLSEFLLTEKKHPSKASLRITLQTKIYGEEGKERYFFEFYDFVSFDATSSSYLDCLSPTIFQFSYKDFSYDRNGYTEEGYPLSELCCYPSVVRCTIKTMPPLTSYQTWERKKV